MAERYDFTIDTLKFRCAITEKTPYARSTAPFRKDQFDSSPTVGDQSLAGWWTRGQLSFHKGAGITFYEVLDGEGVFNRFDYGTGIDPFAEPGRVKPFREHKPATVTAHGQIDDFVPVGDTDYAAVNDAGTLRLWYYWDRTLTTKTLVGGGTVVGLTASARNYYAATSANFIERFAADANGDTPDGKLYSHTSELSGVWYAKDRLWVIARNGSVFAVAAKPTGALPIALASPVATLVDQTNDSSAAYLFTSLTEAPNAVYISRGGSSVYRISLSNDGSVPTLAGAVVACTLPNGETVRCIQYYLGYMVLVTTQGVRIARIDESSGGIIYGPIMITGTTSRARRIACSGSLVWVDMAGTGVFCIDLSSNVSNDSPLSFPYVMHLWPPGSGSIQYGGVGICGSAGAIVWFSGTVGFDVINDGEGGNGQAADCELQTGYHRFGTLDPKVFHSVSVRVDGSYGQIDVSQVDEAGNITLLGSVTADDVSKEFPFTLPAAAERAALKFKWKLSTGDPVWAKAPDLLGYQIKALPAPKRQRILKVPLMIQDHVRLKGGVDTGRKGRAWSDLRALEALESARAIVSFTDHRTSETGSAYIDSVDFQGETPATAQSNGFGGTAYATLRVVS